MTETPLLRGLIAGLALVLLLLGAASIVAVTGTRAIESETTNLVREQLVVARLLNDAQSGQNALAAALHQLTRSQSSGTDRELIRNLEAADAALVRVAGSVANTEESRRWNELLDAVRGFAAAIRGTMNHRETGTNAFAQLFDQHERVARLEQELLEASELRIANAELRIEEDTQQLSRGSSLLLGLCLLLALISSALIVLFVRRSVRNLRWHSEELGRVSWHMLQTQEEAARRFSHELHDELGQSLAAIRANVASEDGNWTRRREDCLELVDRSIADVRELSQLLRPVILDDFGLDAGLRWLTDRFAERTGLETDYRSTFHDRLPDQTETHLFRITQEALTNIARHSGASRVVIQLDSNSANVTLSIQDNGRGLGAPAERSTPSLGLTGMRARARQVGGEFITKEPPSGGLRIDVSVPMSGVEETRA